MRAELDPSDYEEQIAADSYDRSYSDGLAAYAWWKDGSQYVGTTGTTLRDADLNRKHGWNYTP